MNSVRDDWDASENLHSFQGTDALREHMSKVHADRVFGNHNGCILEEITEASRASYLATHQRTNTPNDERVMPLGSDVLTEVTLEAANVAGYCDVLKAIGKRGDARFTCEPTIVVGTPSSGKGSGPESCGGCLCASTTSWQFSRYGIFDNA
jgi:hypothetical protein